MTETTVFHLNPAEAEIIRRRRAQIAEDELRRILREQSPRALAALDKIMARPAVRADSLFAVLAGVLETALSIDWMDVCGEKILIVHELSKEHSSVAR